MRILVLAPQPFYIDRGTPIDVDILVRALTEIGHRVDLVCYQDGQDRGYPGLTIHRAGSGRWLGNTPPGFTWKKLIKDVLVFSRAVRLLTQNEYDVVHAGEEAVFLAMALEALFGVPYVYDMDSSIAQQMVEQKPSLKLLSPVFDAAEGLAIRRSLAAAPVCHALADLARERGAPFIETLHDISQLENSGREPSGFLRDELQIDDPILMYVGNLQPYQGVDLLLESFDIAVGRGSEVDLVIAGGSADSIEKYRNRARTLGIEERVHLIGPWPNERLEELLAEADILTAPRIKGINTPMKIFPYLHTGKPVLVTDLITHNQILDSSIAMLAPAEPEGFARAIETLVGDPVLRRELGRNGRKFVERNHTYPAHRERVGRLYDFVARNVGSLEEVPSED